MKTTQHTNGKLDFSSSEIPMRLVALRKYHGLTQKETGELMGVSSFAVCQWENGSIPNSPNRKRLQKMFAEYEPTAGQATSTVERSAATGTDAKPQQFVLKRHGSASLRFKGVELGTVLVGKGSVTLYATIGGTYVWDAGQELVEGGFAEESVNWGTANEFKLFAMGFNMSSTDDLLDFATECGLEIFEDIE